jgi:hypothetical protein
MIVFSGDSSGEIENPVESSIRSLRIFDRFQWGKMSVENLIKFSVEEKFLH